MRRTVHAANQATWAVFPRLLLVLQYQSRRHLVLLYSAFSVPTERCTQALLPWAMVD